MGWVRERINEQEKLVPLWNTLRDSIGDAVTEYNALASAPSVNRSDCRARAWLCLRISKPGGFIEVFLSDSDRKIKSASGTTQAGGQEDSPGERNLCGYRLNDARTDLEFCDGPVALPSDEVARRALEEFLFTPFPTVRRMGGG